MENMSRSPSSALRPLRQRQDHHGYVLMLESGHQSLLVFTVNPETPPGRRKGNYDDPPCLDMELLNQHFPSLRGDGDIP